MCGICGTIGILKDNAELGLEKMLNTIVHRGPDDRGTYLSKTREGKTIALGHQRLSIIDLSKAGHQPMKDRNRKRWIVYNGEIYNFRTIRKELETKGYKFQSESDTEVILAAYDFWGIEHLHKLNGMFAYVIWDEETETLFAVRDRLGIKPFYYTQTKDGFAFASEIKALLALPNIAAKLNLFALHQYLTFLWTPDPQTTFDGIYKLPPGHYLTWNKDQLIINQYWDVSFSENFEKDISFWENNVREKLEEAVDKQLISDVPLGAFLSGGIDSSSIVGLMSRNSKVQTYTMGINSEDLLYDINPDDTKYARQIGKLFNTDYHENILSPNVIELLPKMVWHLDELVADPAILTSYLICRDAKKTLTVMLSGMGADEIFAGYPRHLAARLAKFYNLFPRSITDPLVALLPGAGSGKFNKTFRNLKKLAKSAALPFQNRYLGYGTYFTDIEKQTLYSSELQQETNSFDAYSAHRIYLDRVKNIDPINQMLYLDLKTFLPCLNLTYSDKTSMAASVEMRVPFLDHEMVEFSAQIPAKLKLHGTVRKYILKRSLKNILPKEILYRKKAGFSAPVRAWLLKDLKPMVDDLLSEENIKKRGYFNPVEVQKLIKDHRQGKEDNALKIYQLLTFEIWCETFLKSSKDVH